MGGLMKNVAGAAKAGAGAVSPFGAMGEALGGMKPEGVLGALFGASNAMNSPDGKGGLFSMLNQSGVGMASGNPLSHLFGSMQPPNRPVGDPSMSPGPGQLSSFNPNQQWNQPQAMTPPSAPVGNPSVQPFGGGGSPPAQGNSGFFRMLQQRARSQGGGF